MAPPAIQDVLRASTLIILFMVMTIWFSGRLYELYKELFYTFKDTNPLHAIIDTFVSKDTSKDEVSIEVIIMSVADWLFHCVPCIVFGLPTNGVSLIVAYGVLLIWNYVNQDRIGEIYAPSITKEQMNKSLGMTAVMVIMYYLVCVGLDIFGINILTTTPTNTPMNTPMNTPTNTPMNTPTNTPTTTQIF